jgi:hypothetical protein
MNRFLKVLIIVVIVIVAFVGVHFFVSGGQLPLGWCTNCHTS